MKLPLILSYFLVNFISLVSAGPPSKTTKYKKVWLMTIYACDDGLEDFTFDYGKGPDDHLTYYGKLCGYTPRLGSLLICAADRLGDTSINFNKTLERASELCHEYGDISLTTDELRNVYENATQYVQEIDPNVNYTSTLLTYPIKANETLTDREYGYLKNLYFNLDDGSFLAGMLNVYFVMVFVLFGTATFIKRLGFHKSFNNRFINWYRAKISIPALFGANHTQYSTTFKIFTTLVPTRIESLVIFFFIGLNVALAAFNYDASFAESKIAFMYDAIADRTGLLSFGLIPLLIILAGRNNILTSLTGISYSSMVFYHKWVARIMWIHALIHSACWTGYGLNYHYLVYYEEEAYWRWGIAATILGGLILFQAFHLFRNMSYETFLAIHIILVIAFILGCWYHCYDLGWLEWLYTAWAVWIFDRLVRIVRMSLFGIQDAEVSLVSEDTFRVEVPYNKFFNPYPGSFAYLYFMTPSLFWQSHPFTVMKSVQKDKHITFYIKTKAGITRRIMKQLRDTPEGEKTIKVCVEGAYGHRATTEKYDKALFFAGGNGIPGPYSHVMDLAQRESASKQETKFIWVIRNIKILSAFSDELFNLSRNTTAQLDIYITGKTDPKIKFDISSDENKEATKPSFTNESSTDSKSILFHGKAQSIIKDLSDRVTFHYERPNVDAMILKEFTEEQGSSVSVMTCGAPRMVDDIRASVASHLQKSKGRVDLYEELQVW